MTTPISNYRLLKRSVILWYACMLIINTIISHHVTKDSGSYKCWHKVALVQFKRLVQIIITYKIISS